MQMNQRALVLVAHADDETLGAGGMIPKLQSQGWVVDVVALSSGVLDVRGAIEDNSGDFKRVCEYYAVNSATLLGYPDQKFDQVPVADMANSVFSLKLNPDMIITHVSSDLNRDHVITCEIAKIVGRPKSKPVSILGMEIPNTSFWNGTPFAANYYVDIEPFLDKKIEAFNMYKNEIQNFPHPWSDEGLTLLAKYHGMQSGLAFAEAFTIIRGYDKHLG
jgi:LmbE family N-acetylglucosaminyl deacetylase